MRTFTLCVLVWITGAGTSHSEPLPVPQPPPSNRSLPSETTAYLHAIAWTGGPVVAGTLIGTYNDTETGIFLIVSGILIGPSAGQYYAGAFKEGSIGLGIRAVSGILIVSAVSSAMQTHADLTGMYLIAAAGTAYSFIDTHFAVKRAHARHPEASGFRATFGPALFPTGNDRLAPGFRIATTF